MTSFFYTQSKGCDNGIPTGIINHHNFFPLEIIFLRLHNINQDTIIRVVCEYHNFLGLNNDGTGKVPSTSISRHDPSCLKNRPLVLLLPECDFAAGS